MKYHSSSVGFIKPFCIIIGIILGVCALGFVTAYMMGNDKDRGQAADFTATDISGESVIFSEVYKKGGAVLIFYDRAQNESKALLTHIADAKQGSQVTTVLVARGEKDGTALKEFLNKNALGADIIICDTDGSVFSAYRIKEEDKVPLSYFVNREGSIRAVSVSNLTRSAAQKYVSFLTK